MKDLQREILGQVAAGTISASEGAARLEALHEPEPAAPPPPAAAPATAPRTVKVRCQLGDAEIVGDPSVAFVIAEGPHVARQDGDTMVIEHALFQGDSGFSFGDRRVVVNGLSGHRDSLVVRMNPELALIANVQAGSTRIDGVHGPISAEVQAGECNVRDFRGPLNVLVQAGDLTATGRLTSGASRVRCAMGEARITLERGSSVRITAHSRMGDVTIDGEQGKSESSGQVVVGSGAATLDVDCTMGSVKVIAE